MGVKGRVQRAQGPDYPAWGRTLQENLAYSYREGRAGSAIFGRRMKKGASNEPRSTVTSPGGKGKATTRTLFRQRPHGPA